MSATLPVYKKKDFQSDQEVRWCPGCGDYAILNAVQQVFPTLGIPKEKFVVVSGIGCSSRPDREHSPRTRSEGRGRWQWRVPAAGYLREWPECRAS